jgi:predicted deacylase
MKSHFDEDPDDDNLDVRCGGEKCGFFYAEITSNKTVTNKPTVLFVGGFHGDERLGPNIITELADTLLRNALRSPIKEYLEQNLILL